MTHDEAPQICQNCYHAEESVEGGLCEDCFRSMPVGKWMDAPWQRRDE